LERRASASRYISPAARHSRTGARTAMGGKGKVKLLCNFTFPFSISASNCPVPECLTEGKVYRGAVARFSKIYDSHTQLLRRGKADFGPAVPCPSIHCACAQHSGTVWGPCIIKKGGANLQSKFAPPFFLYCEARPGPRYISPSARHSRTVCRSRITTKLPNYQTTFASCSSNET
jgi:hypothetical protein